MTYNSVIRNNMLYNCFSWLRPGTASALPPSSSLAQKHTLTTEKQRENRICSHATITLSVAEMKRPTSHCMRTGLDRMKLILTEQSRLSLRTVTKSVQPRLQSQTIFH